MILTARVASRLLRELIDSKFCKINSIARDGAFLVMGFFLDTRSEFQ